MPTHTIDIILQVCPSSATNMQFWSNVKGGKTRRFKIRLLFQQMNLGRIATETLLQNLFNESQQKSEVRFCPLWSATILVIPLRFHFVPNWFTLANWIKGSLAGRHLLIHYLISNVTRKGVIAKLHNFRQECNPEVKYGTLKDITRRFITPLTSASYWTLPLASWIKFISSHSIILISKPRFPYWSLKFKFCDPMLSTRPVHLTLSDLETLMNLKSYIFQGHISKFSVAGEKGEDLQKKTTKILAWDLNRSCLTQWRQMMIIFGDGCISYILSFDGQWQIYMK